MILRTVGLIITLALGVFPGPLAAEAQRAARVWRIGLMHVGLDHVPTSVEVASPNLYIKFSSLILRLASERRIPMAGHWKRVVEQGALFSYSGNLQSVGGDAARYVDKILKGARPADLPVQEISRFELVINLKTARALGLTIPQSALIRADEVIQ